MTRIDNIRWSRWGVAIFLTILIHLATYKSAPLFFSFSAIQNLRNDSSIEIELVTELAPEDEQFVEVNEQAPENIPDDTKNYSFQDQQAASPEPAPVTEKNLPQITDGEEEAHKIVEGKVRTDEQPKLTGIFEDIQESNSEQPSEGMPAIPQPKTTEQLPIEKGDGEGVFAEAKEGEDKEDTEAEKIIDITPIDPQPEVISSINPSITKDQTPKPRPRPRLDLSKISGPIRNSDVSTSRRGTVSIDAKFSQFGEYKQRMFEAIVFQWHKLADRITLGAQDLPSEVEIHFSVDASGNITELTQKRSTAGMLASFICEDAIKSRAPYGEWTEEMITHLGEQTEITITFNYR